MRRLNTKFTFFYKRVFPVLWGCFLLHAAYIATSFTRFDLIRKVGFIYIPFIIALAISTVIIKRQFFDLIDEVYEKDDSLVFINAGKELCIKYSEIKNLNYSTNGNPQQITLRLRNDTLFGDEIIFAPPLSLNPFKKNKYIDEIIDNMDKYRSEQPHRN